MRPSVESMTRARVPGWLRLVDAAVLAAGVCWGLGVLYTHRSADAFALFVAHVAALVSVLSPRFSLEAHPPQAWGISWRAWPQLDSLAFAVAFVAELAWTSNLGTSAFVLPQQPALLALVPSGSKGLALHRHIIAPLLVTAYKVRCDLRVQGETRWPCMR
jgi:hypothetical protein